MTDQLSFCLADEVAPYFNNGFISSLCTLIDEKAQQGMKYQDLKEQLLTALQNAVDLHHSDDCFNIYRRAYEFARYY